MASYDNPASIGLKPVGAFYSREHIAKMIDRSVADVCNAIETLRLPMQLVLNDQEYFAHSQIVRIRAELERVDSGIVPTKMVFRPALQRN